MNHLKIIYLWFFLFSVTTLFAQSELIMKDLKLSQENVNCFKCDHYGNVYTISKNTITKYTIEGEKIAVFSQQQWGDITSIEVHNPMKIMLYFKDAGIILFLDEKLVSISEPFDLYNNYSTVTLASYSTANQIHLFDPSFSELITLDFSFKEIGRLQLPFSDLEPCCMIEMNEKNLAIHDPVMGVSLFDSFGNFDKLIPIFSENICIDQDNIYYIQNQTLTIYNFKTLTFNQIHLNLEEENIKQFDIFRNQMIILEKSGKFLISSKLF